MVSKAGHAVCLRGYKEGLTDAGHDDSQRQESGVPEHIQYASISMMLPFCANQPEPTSWPRC